jgi:hypothetical protein
MKWLKPGNFWSNENFESRRRQLGAEIFANSRRPTRFDLGLVQNPPRLRRPPKGAMPHHGAEIAIAAMIKIVAKTVSNSVSEKPFCFLFIVASLLKLNIKNSREQLAVTHS